MNNMGLFDFLKKKEEKKISHAIAKENGSYYRDYEFRYCNYKVTYHDIVVASVTGNFESVAYYNGVNVFDVMKQHIDARGDKYVWENIVKIEIV